MGHAVKALPDVDRLSVHLARSGLGIKQWCYPDHRHVHAPVGLRLPPSAGFDDLLMGGGVSVASMCAWSMCSGSPTTKVRRRRGVFTESPVLAKLTHGWRALRNRARRSLRGSL